MNAKCLQEGVLPSHMWGKERRTKVSHTKISYPAKSFWFNECYLCFLCFSRMFTCFNLSFDPHCRSGRASQVAQWLRFCLPMQEMQETWVPSLGGEDPLEEEMAIHSNTLAWRIPWTEEPGGLQSIGLQSRIRLSDWTPTYVGLQSWRAGVNSPWHLRRQSCYQVNWSPQIRRVVLWPPAFTVSLRWDSPFRQQMCACLASTGHVHLLFPPPVFLRER